MNPPIRGRRQPLPTILTVYRPIEDYWEAAHRVGAPDVEPSEALDPLDAFLVHRLLDLAPEDPVLIDAAIARTGGAGALIGLHHPRARGVWAVADPESLPNRQGLSALREHLGRRGPERIPLKVIVDSELPEKLAEQTGAVILVDARTAVARPDDLARWLDARPDSLVLVLGLGRVGRCPAIPALLSLGASGSGRQFQLLRDLNETLAASRLGLVARCDHPAIDEMLERLAQSYSGNYRYLDLLREVNDVALREANVDAETLRSNWTFGPLSAEIDELKQKAREADERAEAAARALQEATTIAGRLTRLRRRLSPTPVGGAWRLAKRMRRRLSPVSARDGS
jgi:hypothetical protein